MRSVYVLCVLFPSTQIKPLPSAARQPQSKVLGPPPEGLGACSKVASLLLACGGAHAMLRKIEGTVRPADVGKPV